ncbi:hypothetical protein ES707_21337 [subsurface metagenome]
MTYWAEAAAEIFPQPPWKKMTASFLPPITISYWNHCPMGEACSPTSGRISCMTLHSVSAETTTTIPFIPPRSALED